jgi:alpha-amylase
MKTNISYFFRVFCALLLLCLSNISFAQERRVVLQAFWWDYWHNNYQANWSNYLAELAPRLKSLGIDAIWIPPSVKNGFTHGVGYAPYDNYDLGDKFQKGDVKTRLGTKDYLLRMIAVMHANGIDVIQDVVPNHLIGAGSDNGGGGQDATAWADQWKNFRYSSWLTPATNQTLADYSARSGRFHKNWQNFHPNPDNNCTTGDVCQQMFGPDISYSDGSHGNSGNLAEPTTQASGGAGNGYMRKGTRDWLIWYKKQTGFDGVRLDAVKHYDFRAGEDFLYNLQNSAGWASGGSTMFAVGEYVGSG